MSVDSPAGMDKQAQEGDATPRRRIVRLAAVPAAYLVSTYGTWLAYYLISGDPPLGVAVEALYTSIFAIIYFGVISVAVAVVWLWLTTIRWPSTPASIRIVVLLILATLPLFIRVGQTRPAELAVQAIAQFIFFLATLVIVGRWLSGHAEG